MIYGNTEVLVKSNIQHALVKISILQSLPIIAISVELKNLEKILGSVYPSSGKVW